MCAADGEPPADPAPRSHSRIDACRFSISVRPEIIELFLLALDRSTTDGRPDRGEESVSYRAAIPCRMQLAMWPLLKFVMLLLHCIPAFFRSRNEQAIVELTLRQQLATYVQGPNLESHRSIGHSGSSCHGSGRDGERLWLSFSPTPWSAGIARVSGFTGDPFRSAVLGDLRFPLRYRPSFDDSPMRTDGGLERSKQNSKSSDSGSASPPSLGISRSETRTTNNASAGRRFFAITSMASPRWTSWWSLPFSFVCCMPGS